MKNEAPPPSPPVREPRGPLRLRGALGGRQVVLSFVSPWSQVSDGSLTVRSVSREDRGAYTCRAYSIQGEAVHTTHLLVQGNRGLPGCFVPGAFLWEPRRVWLAQLGAGGSGQL